MANYMGDEVHARPLEVVVRYTGDSKEERDRALEKALSQFKKLVMREGILLELRERESFQSPGRKRYLQRQKSKYRQGIKKDKNPSYKKRMSFVDKKIVSPNAPLIRWKDGKPVHEQPKRDNKQQTNTGRQHYQQRRPYQRPVHSPVQR